jgi:IS605 OrfB family transposase
LAKKRKPLEVVSVSRTIQMRLHGEYPQLDDMAARFSAARIACYRVMCRNGTSFDDQKNHIVETFELPSRVFNAIRKSLEGSVRSIQEKASGDIAMVEDKIETCAKVLEKTEARIAAHAVKPLTRKALQKLQTLRFYKTCSLQRLKSRLKRLIVLVVDKTPSICFGSRKLFNAQHHLAANKLSSLDDWRETWRDARSDEFMVVGSSDEASGNSTCQAVVNDNGTVSLRLGLGGDRGHLNLPDLRLSYGHDQWVERILSASGEAVVGKAWAAETNVLWQQRLTEHGEAWGPELLEQHESAFRKNRTAGRRLADKIGSAIAYRFKRDHYGWRVLITISHSLKSPLVNYCRGAIGLDLNDGHISRARVDETGVLVDQHDIRMVMAGLSSGQREAVLHEIALGLVEEAKHLNVPLVIETLDFAAKKRRLKEVGCAKAARRLSSFAYTKFRAILASHALRAGVAVVEVNPAYTSMIGAVLHAVPNGLTVHGAAAMAIARRGSAVEEKVPTDGIQLWMPGQKPLSLEIPVDLRSKALEQSSAMVWKGLVAAVRVARGLAYKKRQTGHELRRLAAEARRKEATLADDAEFLLTYGDASASRIAFS